jgi:hypothetical protein
LAELIAQGLRQIGHLGERTDTFSVKPSYDLIGAVSRLPQFGKPLLQLVEVERSEIGFGGELHPRIYRRACPPANWACELHNTLFNRNSWLTSAHEKVVAAKLPDFVRSPGVGGLCLDRHFNG